jgi:cold shock CspA family protein
VEGVVKFFSEERYFGFVQLTDESGAVFAEYFFHGTKVVGKAP